MILGPRLTPVLILMLGFSLMMCMGEGDEGTPMPEAIQATPPPVTGAIDCREVAQKLWDLTGVVGSRDEARIKTTSGKRVVTNPRKSRAITQLTLTCNGMTQKDRACVLDAAHKKDLSACGFGPGRR